MNTLIKSSTLSWSLKPKIPLVKSEPDVSKIEEPLIKTTLKRCTGNDQTQYRGNSGWRMDLHVSYLT